MTHPALQGYKLFGRERFSLFYKAATDVETEEHSQSGAEQCKDIISFSRYSHYIHITDEYWLN